MTNYMGNYMGTKNSVLENCIGKNKHPSQAYPVELYSEQNPDWDRLRRNYKFLGITNKLSVK